MYNELYPFIYLENKNCMCGTLLLISFSLNMIITSDLSSTAGTVWDCPNVAQIYKIVLLRPRRTVDLLANATLRPCQRMQGSMVPARWILSFVVSNFQIIDQFRKVIIETLDP